MATTTLRPSSTLENSFALAGGAASAHGTLGRVFTTEDTPLPADGTLQSSPAGTTCSVQLYLPGIPRLAGITEATIRVYSYLDESQVAGGSTVTVFLYDTDDAVIDDEVVFTSNAAGQTSQWSSSTTSVTTSNQLSYVMVSVSPTTGSYFDIMAVFVDVTYTATSGLSDRLQIVFPATGLKTIGATQ